MKLINKVLAGVLSAVMIFSLGVFIAPHNDVSANNGVFEPPYYMEGTHANPTNSYIYERPDGGLTTVNYVRRYDSNVMKEFPEVWIKNYSANKTSSTLTVIPCELPKFGGFYHGKDYNFLVFGDKNPDKSDSKEVVRIVKYDHNWNRLESASIYGFGIQEAFAAGTLRMAEDGKYLYIATAIRMYSGHQANSNFLVDTEAMSILDGSTEYVSHSFNQFIFITPDCVYRMHHGDAYPRSLVLFKRSLYDKAPVQYESKTLMTFPGKTGRNATGCNIGDAELVGQTIVIAGKSVDYGAQSVRNMES